MTICRNDIQTIIVGLLFAVMLSAENVIQHGFEIINLIILYRETGQWITVGFLEYWPARSDGALMFSYLWTIPFFIGFIYMIKMLIKILIELFLLLRVNKDTKIFVINQLNI